MRPACSPCRNTSACPGVVAYHRHSGRFVLCVISLAADQVTPSSSLTWTNTRRPSAAATWPRLIFSSVAEGPCRTKTSTIRPSSSTTGAGFPAVPRRGSVATTCSSPHVRPPSDDRLSTRSMCPESDAEPRRPSANASTVPSRVTTTAGIR
jgi:hypothetical protein